MNKLRRMFIDKGLRQDRAAEILGVSESMLSRWLNGYRKPDEDQWRQLAAFLRVKVEEIR